MTEHTDMRVPYWAPYHLNRFIWWMTRLEAADREVQIRTEKPPVEQPTRLAAFRIVLRPERLPAPVVTAWQAYVTARQAYDTAWQAYVTARQAYVTARQAYDTAWQAYDTARQAYATAWQAYVTAVSDHWDELNAQRLAEYPDAPPYDRITGLAFPDGYRAED